VSGVPNDTGWHFIAGEVTQPGDLKVWLDGAQVGTTTATVGFNLPGSVNFTVGQQYGGGAFSNADIARVGVWARSLGADLAALFNSGNGKSYADLTTAEKVDLVSYWDMDEVSGNRADSHGSNTLTDNNTVTARNSGPAGVVAKFTAATSESLSKTSFSITPNGGYTFAGWFENTSAAGIEHAASIIGQFIFSYSNMGHMLVYDNGGFSQTSPALTPVVDSGLHFVVGWVDESVGKAYYQVDDGTIAEVTYSAPYVTPSGTLEVGVWNGQYYDGRGGRLGAWNRPLTTGERTSLFNSGNGKAYADLTAGEKTGLVSYWNMYETSGSRADSHGSNTLTDNNTVTSVINAGGAMKNVAASFVAANSESLSRATVADVIGTGATDFTLAVWVKALTVNGSEGNHIFNGGVNNEGPAVWLLANGATDHRLYAWVPAAPFVSIGDARRWMLIIAEYDAGTPLFRAKAMGSELNSGVWTATGTPTGFDDPFYFGRSQTYGRYFDGLMDQPLVWSRILSAQEHADLFNDGVGRFYPDI